MMSAKRQVWLNLPLTCQIPSCQTRWMGMDCCTLRGILNGTRSPRLAAARVLRMAARPLSDWGRIGREKGEKLLFHRDLLQNGRKEAMTVRHPNLPRITPLSAEINRRCCGLNWNTMEGAAKSPLKLRGLSAVPGAQGFFPVPHIFLCSGMAWR